MQEKFKFFYFFLAFISMEKCKVESQSTPKLNQEYPQQQGDKIEDLFLFLVMIWWNPRFAFSLAIRNLQLENVT